jgi:hypothetical protein
VNQRKVPSMGAEMQVVYAIRRTYVVISFLYKGRFTGLLRQWRTRSTHKQREGNMNTITINTETDEQVATITYTETEVLHFRKRAQEIDAIQQVNDLQRKEIRDLRNNVRDFFSEGEWSDGEQTVNKPEVNELLERIGASKLTTKYNGTFTITGSFSIEVENEDEIEDIITQNTDISNWSADMDADQIEVHDVEEDN